MPQSSIPLSPARAFAGQIAESGAPRYSRSFKAEGAGLSAGQPALRGTDAAKQCLAVTDSATVDASTLAGFVVLETSRQEGGIADKDPVTCMREGVMYVLVSAAVSAGDDVYIGNTTATLGDIEGAAGAGLVQVPGARFAESAGLGELAAIELDL